MRQSSSVRAYQIFVVCCILAFLLPYRTYPYSAFYNDYVVLIGVLVALAALTLQRARATFWIPATISLPLGIAFVIFIQAATERMLIAWDAVIPIGYLIAAAAAMVLGANFHDRERSNQSVTSGDRYLGIVLAFVIAGVMSSFFALLQYLKLENALGDLVIGIGNDGQTAVRPYANLGQPNQLALLICWSIAGTWWLFQRRMIQATGAMLITVVLLISLAITQAKIAWLILPALLVVSEVMNRKAETRRIPRWVLSAFAALFVVLVFLLPLMAELSGTMVETPAQRMGSNRIRLVLWQQALWISMQSPWTGVGWLGFPVNQLIAARHFGTAEYATHAHNIVANFAAELGWPITLVIVASAIWWFVGHFVKRKWDVGTAFVLMVLVATFIHSLLEFPLWYAYILIPVSFLVGLVGQQPGQEKGFTLSKNYVFVLVLTGAAAMAMIANDYRRVVLGFRVLVMERIGSGENWKIPEKPSWTIFPEYYDYFRFADMKAAKGMSKDQISFMEGVEKRFGYAPVLMRMASVYGMNGRPDDAVATMVTIQHLFALRYAEAYKAWQSMATDDPITIGPIFRRLPAPDF